jgi:hypothetical protein
MKKFFVVLGLLFISNSYAQQGGVIGGGGNGVVCRSGDEIVSVELLDLYESRILHNRDYDSMESMTLDEAISQASQKLYPYNLPLAEANYYFFKGIHLKFHYLPSGVRLDPINDSGHIFIPAGCKIEQVANFYNNEKVFIVSDYYKKMDNLSKAALIVHEALYWKERLSNVDNSRYTRRVVGAIFDRNFIFEDPSLESTNSKKLICSTPMGKTEGAFNYEFNAGLKKTTTFEAIKTDNNSYRLQFLVLNGHTVYSLKHYYVSNVNFNWLERGKPSEDEWSTASSLSSKFDSDEMFEFSYAQKNAATAINSNLKGYRVNQIKASWTGSDPGDSFKNVEFLCHEVEYGDIDPTEINH